MNRVQLLGAGALSLLIAWFLSGAQPAAFLQSYLFSWVFWLGISIGAQALLLVHRLTSGKWGELVGPYLRSSAATLLPVLLLAIPVLAGIRELYPWAQPDALMIDPELKLKAGYLNHSFFLIRSIAYLTIWFVIHRFHRKLGAGLALVLYFLSSTFAMVDWVMTLEPHWYSTTYGFLFITAQALSAMSLALFTLTRKPGIADPPRSRDLGNLLLAMVMIWTYINFMQYLIIWSGNIPEEVTWISVRSNLGWQWIVLLLFAFQFSAPFLLLLFRRVKERPFALGGIALLVLIMQVVDIYWLVIPSFHRESAIPRLSDLLCLLGIGGIWLWSYLRGMHETA